MTKDAIEKLIKACDLWLDSGVRTIEVGDYQLDIELIKSIAVCQELNPITLVGTLPVKDVEEE